MYIKEAFHKLYSGEEAFSRHVTLFSICGLVGLFDAYVSTVGIESVGIFTTLFYALVWVLYSMFFIGYETLFLHERVLPESDFRSFKVVCCKPLLVVLAVSILLLVSKFFPQYLFSAFILELFLAVPLTAIQAGYSYNFNSDDIPVFIKRFCLNDYVSLLLKRILLVICAYIFVSIVLFVIFFIVGFVIAIIYRDVSEIGLIMGALQTIVVKLSNFISSILFVYVLSIGSLVWDYELIRMKERENESDSRDL